MNTQYTLLLSLAFAAQLSAMETQPLSTATINRPSSCTDTDDIGVRFVYLERLCAAIKIGDISSVKSALSKVTDVNAALPDTQDTPLHVAHHTITPNVEILALLLARGANQMALNSSRHTPVQGMVSRWRNSQLLDAIQNKYSADTVAQLLKDGSNPNTQLSNKSDVLSLALSRGQYDVVVVLLDHGANPKKTYDSNNTALHLLASHGPTFVPEHLICGIAQRLLDAGVPIDAKNSFNITAMEKSRTHSSLKKLTKFLKRIQFPKEPKVTVKAEEIEDAFSFLKSLKTTVEIEEANE